MPITLGHLAPLDGAKRQGFLEKALWLRLATAPSGGRIHISPVVFVTVDDAIYIALDPTVGDPGQTTTPDHRHIETIDAGGTVSALIDQGDELASVRAVTLEGHAEPVTDPEDVEQLLDLVAEKYFHVGHPHLEYYFSAGNVAARRWYRIVPEHIDGWDMRVLPQPPISDLLRFPAHVHDAQ
ncbi:pyridoxamine 5'-phosphate oxidase family protein [Gordonia sp. zg691]|uniref:Pyridoxamine 5'-phosphate oxidase family protein n=1 Tax=Gordonia jinghuaiqii TaxID=2758710 RepID=A0A7D7R350_9ACTN|nr:pyridoxamine 5'-phosphate oxidase family protein [Gordonia jinghuaiqii]MBD0862921.1 pyridoxamine 5'-phosphate oxidase family protein [Gordonia jinghuaiqii]MCR5978954.1 hypothetical protein [Gordonia jinghuaiqii]QMT01712.1 pyridoxamine 5'-phosphate oxidase family protein [Gordonia jinghuaiqii]